MGPHRIAAHGLARTFQVPQLFPDLTVAEHIALARRYATSGRSELAEELLVECGFAGAALEREARLFSHGEQRFLEICMALLRTPDVLLLDEPAAGLSQREIDLLQSIVERASALGIGLIVVEHHHDFVRDIADRILVMHLGRAVWCGPPAEFASSEDVRRAYLGVSP
jgi:branched-chain amino acid transport system permease protein